MNWRKEDKNNEDEFNLDNMDLNVPDNPTDGTRPSQTDFILLLIEELDKKEESSNGMLQYYYEELRVIRNRRAMCWNLLKTFKHKNLE
ncbi:MAG: hypothetical protein KAX49_12905 [Halanaerobiales bacterium]|nr:hypothetical protein [Halanaerobiales bacterium]